MPKQTRVTGHWRRKPGGFMKTVPVSSHQRVAGGRRTQAANSGCPLAVLTLTLVAAPVYVAARAI